MKFNFHGNYTSQEQKLFIDVQNFDLEKICVYLQTTDPNVYKIIYEVFDTREGKQTNDPNHSISRASARYNENTIYRFWLPTEDPHFPHEITHLVAHTWGTSYILETEVDTFDNKKITKKMDMVSTSFMQEGLAIAVDDLVFERPLIEKNELKRIDDWCRALKGSVPLNLLDVINLKGFCSLPNEVVIPFTASFSKYLLQAYGLEKYKLMYCGIRETFTPKVNVEFIENVYGKLQVALIKEWQISILK